MNLEFVGYEAAGMEGQHRGKVSPTSETTRQRVDYLLRQTDDRGKQRFRVWAIYAVELRPDSKCHHERQVKDLDSQITYCKDCGSPLEGA